MTDIKKISSETQEAMRRKSAANLPDSPRDHGYTPQQIKAAFVRLILDNKESIVAEINRIVEESNAGIGEKLNASEISSWAKAPAKPTYTAAEVGALPVGTKIPHKTSDIINDSGFITALVSNLANYYTKDSVYTKAEVDSAIPTDNASLLNGAGYVGKNVSDLVNYYLKTETMTKSEINALIASLSKIEFRKVDSLPEVGEAGIIYLVPAENTADNDKYEEFFWQNDAWEHIGDTSVEVKSLVEDALRQAQQSGSFNGANGITPHIGSNGNWFIGDEDTGKPSRGEKGDPTDVQQTTGQSTTSVMSQKAITDIFASKEYLSKKIADIDIPDYVKAEAEATIAKSFLHGNLGRTIRFIATSDSHNDANNMATANPNIAIGNKHCGQAIQYIADRIGLDFIAFLGDATWAGTADLASAYSQSMLIQDIEQFNGFITDGYKGIPNIRIVGNHDQLYTTKDTSGRLWNSGAYNLFGRYCNGIKDIPAGYGYLDLESAKVRVIYLNTSDIPSATTAGTYLGMTQEQINWLSETLLDVGDKADWKILILSHAPLDLINKSDVLTAYVNGTMYGSNDFANHNLAQLLANVHGHVHCYSYGYMGDKIRRFCIPNSNFQDNNHYKDNTSYAQWADSITYPKTANTGKDTAFSLVTIDLDTNMCYVDNYGAGIDREFSCDYYTPVAPTVLLNLDRDYVAGTTDESVANHLDESKAYTNVGYGNLNFYAKACTQSDVSENSVTVKESGTGGISIAYPVHLPDLATQDYVLSFDYSGAGKQRAYYKLCKDTGAIGALHSIIDDTAGASGTKSEIISSGGEAFTWLIVMFSSNTGNTKSYTNVKLEKTT